MKIEVLNNTSIGSDDLVSVKKMNHIYEICYLKHRNLKNNIQLLDKDNYMLLSTGEVKACNHIDTRADNKAQVSQSLKRLRDYINTNVVDVSNCKWLTLTYAENMTDSNRLYFDFKNFVKRLKYRYGHFEYIVACEPQARGAWHCHCIIIFDKKAPFIPNKEIASIWGLGFTKTNKLDDIDNIGAYLTAYLGDMELSSCIENNIYFSESDIKSIDCVGNIKCKNTKKFVKGARLSFYPPKFNIYRISRGIKKPIKEYYKYKNAKEKIGLGVPTYSKSIRLSDSNTNFDNLIIYEYYNTKRI